MTERTQCVARLRTRGLSKTLVVPRVTPARSSGIKLGDAHETAQGGQPQVILQNITFDAQGGEVTCILGPSGCGKSTLLRILAGVWEPDASTEGAATVYDLEPNDRDAVAWMPQRSPLVQSRTVLNNVAIGALVRGHSGGAARRVAERFLEMVDLSGWSQAFPHELSGGMQQRVALARTLAAEPRILLLDEPLSSLDLLLRQRIAERLRDYARDRRAVVIITTHTIEESISFANRVLILNGRPSRLVARVSLSGRAVSVRTIPSDDVVCATKADMFARVYEALGASADQEVDSP